MDPFNKSKIQSQDCDVGMVNFRPKYTEKFIDDGGKGEEERVERQADADNSTTANGTTSTVFFGNSTTERMMPSSNVTTYIQ